MRMHESTKAARVAAALMIAMAATATTAHAQQLLFNADFELFDPSDASYIPGWDQTSPEGGQRYNNAFSSGEFARNEGGRSFKAYAPFLQYAGSVGIQSVTATPGTSYTLSGYMFSPSTDRIVAPNFAILQLGFLNAANGAIGAPVEAQFTAATAPDQWLPFTVTATAPVNAAKVNVVIGFIKMSPTETTTPLGAVYWDDLSLTAAVTPTESNWIATSSGGWLSGSNWQGAAVPNAVGAVANFGSSNTGPATVTIASAGATAGTVRFNSANAYTVAGSGPNGLTLDVSTGTAALNVQQGSHAINAPLVLNDSTVATVAGGSTLTVGGALTIANGSTLSSAGAGTLRIAATSVVGSAGATVRANGGIVQADADLGNNVDVRSDAGEVRFGATQHVRSLSVASGAKATLTDVAASRVIRTTTLSVASGGTLDLGDNALIVDYAGSSPIADVRTALAAGEAGDWAGTGITSSKAASDARYAVGYAEASSVGSPATFAGESGIDATAVLVRVTLKGDSDLNGIVEFDDLLTLSQNYNVGTGLSWRLGDSDYNGLVNFDDLLALSQNYNLSALTGEQQALVGASFASDFALAQSMIPEPASLAAIAGAAGLVARRRRR